MTSDAKIGLLLGLVFIFVIAFIINGLPNFGNRSQAEATPMINQDENFGVADNAQNAQEQLDWDSLLEQESDALADFEPAATESDPGAVQPEPVVAAENEDVRSVYTFDSLMGGVSRTIEDVVKGFGEASRSTVLQAEASEPAPAIEVAESRLAPQPAEPARSQRTAAAEGPGRNAAPKIYVVQAGDVLATVAKKAYGLEEGNRLVNINRIFTANRNTLKTADEIFVGQKLIIPPLSTADGAGKPAPTLSEALFEKVQDIGKRNLAEMREDKPQGRYHVVQDGDSLWKIATSQLGNGARFEEIAELNADVLKSKDALAIGTRLRLPSK